MNTSMCIVHIIKYITDLAVVEYVHKSMYVLHIIFLVS